MKQIGGFWYFLGYRGVGEDFLSSFFWIFFILFLLNVFCFCFFLYPFTFKYPYLQRECERSPLF